MLTREQQLELFYWMQLTRSFDESMVALWKQGAVGWWFLLVPWLLVAPLADLAARLSPGPPAQADRMLANLPHADSHIFEESGHFPFIEEQPAFLETVRSWVNGLD